MMIRRIVLPLITLVFTAGALSTEAQTRNGIKGKSDTYWSRSQKFGFGLRAGPTLTFATVTDKFDKPKFGTLPKAGFTVAGVMTMPLREGYSFYTEAGYLKSGRIMKILETGWQSNFTYHFLTSSMGLTRGVNIRLREDLQGEFFFSIGPNITYMMGGSGKLITGSQGGTSEFDLKIKNRVATREDSQRWGDFRYNYIFNPNRFLFGLDMSIGGEAPLSAKQKLFAEFRFTWGHTNLGTRETSNKLEIVNYDDTMFVNLKTVSFNLIYTYDYDRRKSKQGKSTESRSSKNKKRR